MSVFSISGAKDVIAKVTEKLSATVSTHKEPDPVILESFTSNGWKAVYLLSFYGFHLGTRFISLWFIFRYILGSL